MGRRYETEDWHDVYLTLDGICIEATVHVEGWYVEGDAWGYGEEPPDGDEEVVGVEITLAYDENTNADVPVTEELKNKVIAEVNRGGYW